MKISKLVLPLAGCWMLSLPLNGAWAATPKDVLVVAKSADPQTLDPAVTIDNNDWTITYPAYQRLVRYRAAPDASGNWLEGDLAKSWSVGADGLTWDFKLVGDAKFADGTPVDAAAVKFSLDRLMAMKQGPSEPFPAGTTVIAVDKATVRFVLKTPFAPFLSVLATNGTSIVNPKVMAQEKNGDKAQGWLSGHTAGSGAFQLASWQKGQSIVMETNPHHAGPKPAFSKVIVKFVPDASARRLQLQAGDLDIAEDLPADQVDNLKKTGAKQGVAIAEYPSLRVTYLYLNNKRPPLDRPEVRRAIVQAIDTRGIIDGILLGKAQPLAGPVPHGMWGAEPGLQPVVFAPAQAKAALAKAGVRDPRLSFVLSDKDPAWAPIALTVQANLADVGAKVQLENLANATFRERLGKGEFDIAIGNWSPDFHDPYMFLNYWFDSGKQGMAGNRAFYANPKADALLAQAAAATSQAERTRLYQEVQRLVVPDAPYVYLFQRSTQIALRSSVKGLVYNPMLEQIYNFGSLTKAD